MNDVSTGQIPSERRIYSVSEITAAIKSLLEDRFAFVWVDGEISNVRTPSSGHCYFTLKDHHSQIGAVMFRGQNRNLRFALEDGLTVVGLGRVSVYEPRGTYQIIFEYIEPKGIGALQLAFEKLKKRLADEGLFDARHKKPIPALVQRISLITSPTGAAVHDIIQILFRRYPNVALDIVPVTVQGDEAPDHIAAAFHLIEMRAATDVIILARGGGSLEDLQAFNSEKVARAIFSSPIAVISAVGHEIDFTISDFVADLRASTPSAAAELVVPVKSDLVRRLTESTAALRQAMRRCVDVRRQSLSELQKRLVDPKKQIDDWRLRLDDLAFRCANATFRGVRQCREKLAWRRDALISKNPKDRVNNAKEKLDDIGNKLLNSINILLEKNKNKLAELAARQQALSPAAVLGRGYSITRTIPDGSVVRHADDVDVHQLLEIILATGTLTCRVERKRRHGKEDL